MFNPVSIRKQKEKKPPVVIEPSNYQKEKMAERKKTSFTPKEIHQL